MTLEYLLLVVKYERFSIEATTSFFLHTKKVNFNPLSSPQVKPPLHSPQTTPPPHQNLCHSRLEGTGGGWWADGKEGKAGEGGRFYVLALPRSVPEFARLNDWVSSPGFNFPNISKL